MTAPLTDEELRAWEDIDWMDDGSANLRDAKAMARELLARRADERCLTETLLERDAALTLVDNLERDLDAEPLRERAERAEALLAALMPLMPLLDAWEADPRGADDCIRGRALLGGWQAVRYALAEEKP